MILISVNELSTPVWFGLITASSILIHDILEINLGVEKLWFIFIEISFANCFFHIKQKYTRGVCLSPFNYESVKLVFEVIDGMKTDNYSWPSPFPLPIQYYCYWCSYIQSFTPLVSTKVLVFGAQNPIMYSFFKCLYRQGSTDYKCWLRIAGTEWKPFIRHLAQVMVKAVQRTQAEEKLMYHQRQTSGQWMIRWHCDNDAVWQHGNGHLISIMSSLLSLLLSEL